MLHFTVKHVMSSWHLEVCHLFPASQIVRLQAISDGKIVTIKLLVQIQFRESE